MYDREDVKYDCKNRTKNYLYNHFILCNKNEKNGLLFYKNVKRGINYMNLNLKKLQKNVIEIMKTYDPATNGELQKCLEVANKVKLLLSKIFEMKDFIIVRFPILEVILHNLIGF